MIADKAIVIAEVIKHLPGKHDQGSHAGNRATHEEFMKGAEELARAKDTLKAIQGDYDRAYKKGDQAGLAYHSKLEDEAEKKVATLSERLKLLSKTGQYSHPEWGKFFKAENAEKEGTTYKSPSGDTVYVYHRPAWSRQHVAASSYVESGGGRKNWSGNSAREQANKFLKEVYGIG